jgi:hypothetical protein
MLAVQMVGTHHAILEFLRRAAQGTHILRLRHEPQLFSEADGALNHEGSRRAGGTQSNLGRFNNRSKCFSGFGANCPCGGRAPARGHLGAGFC